MPKKEGKHIPFTHEYRGKRYEILEVVPNKKAILQEKKRLELQNVSICAVDGREHFGGYLIYARMKK